MSVPLDADGPTYCFGCGGGLGKRSAVHGIRLRGERFSRTIEVYICEPCAVGRAERVVSVTEKGEYRSYESRLR